MLIGNLLKDTIARSKQLYHLSERKGVIHIKSSV